MTDARTPVKLATFTHELEAGVLVNDLRQRGIEAQSTGEALAGWRVEAPADVEVIVPVYQLEQAKQIMAGLNDSQQEVDWSQVDTGDMTDPDADFDGRVSGDRIMFDRITIVSLVLGLVVSALWGLSLLFL